MTKPAPILLKVGIWISFGMHHRWVKGHNATQKFLNFETLCHANFNTQGINPENVVEIYTLKIMAISPTRQRINHVDGVGTITEKWHIGGLVQDCSISSANALEILQYCTKPSVSRNNLGKVDMYHACQCIGCRCWAKHFLACSSEVATVVKIPLKLIKLQITQGLSNNHNQWKT